MATTKTNESDGKALTGTAVKAGATVVPESDRKLTGLTSNKPTVLAAVVAGLLAGLVSGFIASHYWSKTPAASKQVLVQQESGVTGVIKAVSPSVVSISSSSTTTNIFGGSQTQQGEGTGIILTATGLILTNKHVVPADASGFTVYTSDGKQYKNAKVIARDSINDVAFVKIEASGLTPAKLGDSSKVQIGQSVLAIGNALGQFNNTATTGIISGIGRSVQASDEVGTNAEDLQNLFQTDAAINPGNSGGPLVNLNSEVIGMNTAVAGNAQNIGFAIPINDIKTMVSSVESGGKIVRPYLGVRYVPLTPDVASQNSLSVSAGAWVVGDASSPAIISGSPAAKAGLQDGDVIVKVGSVTIDDTHSLTSLIGAYKVGDKVSLTVIRGGKTITKTVTLAQAPQS